MTLREELEEIVRKLWYEGYHDEADTLYDEGGAVDQILQAIREG